MSQRLPITSGHAKAGHVLCFPKHTHGTHLTLSLSNLLQWLETLVAVHRSFRSGQVRSGSAGFIHICCQQLSPLLSLFCTVTQRHSVSSCSLSLLWHICSSKVTFNTIWIQSIRLLAGLHVWSFTTKLSHIDSFCKSVIFHAQHVS